MDAQNVESVRSRLATASLYCLALWLAVWAFFMLLRFSPLDPRQIPGAGPLLLFSLAYVVLAPIVGGVLSLAAIVHQPGVRLGWFTLVLAIAAFCIQGIVFMATKWL